MEKEPTSKEKWLKTMWEGLLKANPAFPLQVTREISVTNSGLSKREYYACAAMQGQIASDKKDELPPEYVALLAVRHADALIAELKKESTK